jgi:hypothetical protein
MRLLTLIDQVEEVGHLLAIVQDIDQDDITPEHRAALESELLAAIHGTRQKVDRTAAALAALENAEAAAASEGLRLSTRRDRFRRQREQLEQYCLAIIQASGLKALDGFTATLKPRNNPPAVWVAPAAELPLEFLRDPKPAAPSPDKAAIKQALDRGEYVPGCRITRTVRLVRS